MFRSGFTCILCGCLVWGAVANLHAFAQEAAESSVSLEQRIDQAVARQHSRRDESFAPACTDQHFVRRVYLDLTGTVPTLEQLERFQQNSSNFKRNELIDELIDSPAFGTRLADIWDVQLTHPDLGWPLKPFSDWLATQFNQNRPWDHVVYELLTATGPQHAKPAVTAFMVQKGSTRSPESVADLIGRCFMGETLECAQCHDHPSGTWSHEQYWGIAGFFGGTQLSTDWPASTSAPVRSDWEMLGASFGVANIANSNPRYRPPERALKVSPRFPDGSRAFPSPGRNREAFAIWLLFADTPYLAKSFVNHAWHQLFGCGLVSPIDDHRPDNPPLYDELYWELIADFRDHKYDIKQLYRGICRSQTYQQQSRSQDDPRSLAGVNQRAASSNQVFETLRTILGDEVAMGKNGIYGARGTRRSFVNNFGDESTRGQPAKFGKSIPDFLRMMNSHEIESAIRSRVAKDQVHWDEIETMIHRLYASVLSREPSEAEMDRMHYYVINSPSPEEGYRGVLWALLNTGEFYLVP